DNAIIEKWTGVDGYPFVVRYLNQTTSENGKIRGLQSSDGSNSSGVNSTVTVNDEQFHHIAFLKEGSNISLYIDGILQGTGQDTATGITQNGSPLFLGRRGANNTEFDTFFTGSIDEVAIYNSALSPSAIADQYDVGQGRITAMPLGGLMIANANSITANAAINANSIDMTSNRITLQEFTTTSSGNAVSLTADEINLTGGANSITGIGNLLLQPRTASENIVIAGVEQSGTLDLSLNDLAALSDGFNSITIGRDNSSGAIRVANNVTFQDPVTIQSPVGPGTISANSTIIGLDNASITLTANQDITLQDITTVNNQISIISNSGDIIANSIDAGSDVILKASEGAIRILDTIPSTNLSIRANNSITIESGTPKFTIGDATTNGTALNITDGDGTISATPNFIVPGGIYQHEQGNITIITPLVLPEPSPEPPPEPLPEPLPLDPIISVQPTPPPPLTQTVTDEKNKDLILRTTTREDVARFLDQNQIPEAILFIDILFSEELGAYIEQRTTRELKSFADIQERLNATTSATGTKPAILYTFARPEQLDLVLVTPSGIPIHKSVPTAKREVLLETIADLRRQITNPIKLNTTSYLPAAQQLYQWIIAPLETELKTQGINTIVFAMDTGLRSVPVAALHDGQQFLVENYNLGLIPSLNLTDTRYQSLQDTQILAMGAAQFTDANPLPAVPTELAIITGKLWQGKSFLNQEFTLENLKAQRQEQPFGIIHLATHGEFKPGQPDNSYIHLWDTKLRLDQLRELRWYDPPVELLVLSACRTAVGDEQAELGFAGLAVQAGVKSALGSLWYVSDEGTLGLMSEFYRQLQNAPIKSEALRQAQLGMIQEKVRLEAGELHGSGENLTLPPELAQLGDKNLSHPYYWSAFTMIGSPW
ncbi:MAG TPA: hypothetical protein DCL61_21905, partial [Cyanobacteria bacterium UBA12227]|nr:hypothetical protein [Cyanobacteria bacterium UBA12227]